MEIENYLKHNPVEYDFSDESASENYYNIKNGVKKFFAYMLESKKDNFKDNEIAQKKLEENGYILTDPDNNSNLMQQIYKILWNVEDDSMKKCIDRKMIKGDVLNSANTTIDYYYTYIEDGLNKKESKLPRKICYIISNYITSENSGNNNEIINEILNNKELEKFVKCYHTIGNFMPVPVGTNGPRGLSQKIMDYWDLTLLYIYNYYINKDDNGIRYILNKVKNKQWRECLKTKLYIDWLDTYDEGEKGWHNFITRNYLEAFVDKNYFPKKLWKRHFEMDNNGEIANVAPLNKDECIEYFVNAKECIYQRGNQLVDVLKNKLKEKGIKL